MDIAAWLADLGLERYEPAFRENEIDSFVLPSLTADDLKDLGVVIVGHRRKLLEAIAGLKAASAAPSVAPSFGFAGVVPQRDAERRQLTVMFVDLVGSTALSAKLDPEDMHAVIRLYQNTVAGEIARFEGHIAKFMGDGVLAYFGWPGAHEDEAERAVRAGLAVTESVLRLQTLGSEPLQTRIGIATGLVVVGDLIGEGAAREQAVVGDTLNLAARLQGAAEPGMVVIADSTRHLIGDLFLLRELGSQSFKGVAEPVPACAVLGEHVVESRFAARRTGSMAPIVARDQELALLMERWRQAKSGEGQMVLLTGEAGIGKSRIAEALIDALRAEPHFLLRYQCSPYHIDSALYPAIQQISHAASLVPGDAMDPRLDRLEALLAKATNDIGEAAPLIAELIGLDAESRYGELPLTPQQRRNRTLAVLIDHLVGLAGRKPVLWVIEDAHWIDPTTLELVELALDRIQTARVLALITARPTFLAPFGSHPVVTRLALNRLGRDGRFKEAHLLTEKALESYDPALHRDLLHRFGQDARTGAANYSAWILWHLGFPDRAASVIEANMRWVRELNHANTTGLALCYGATLVNIWLRRPEQVERAAREALRLADEMSMALWHAWGRVHLGWALSQQDPTAGLEDIEAGLREAHLIRARRLEPLHLGILADAYSRAGRHGDAEAQIAKAFEALADGRHFAFAAELHRMRGVIALRAAASAGDEAEADFRRAIEIARQQEALSPQLRAARDLARLLAEEGERRQAADLLAPLYSAFTEGFDTSDLKEARTLLDELRA